MQRLLDVRSEGPAGPAYLRFSHAPVTDSGPVDEDDDVVVDTAQTAVSSALKWSLSYRKRLSL